MMARTAISMSELPEEILENIMGKMDIKQRCSCAQVSQNWKVAAAAAATSSIVLDEVRDVTSLQKWLEEHGGHVEVLQLQAARFPTALPCPRLLDLHLHADSRCFRRPVDDRVWEGISAATQLESVSLSKLEAARGSEEVMAVLAALPKLQHLSWCSVKCSGETYLPGVASLQGLTKLTGLELRDVTAGALEQLSALTNLRHLSLDYVLYMWGEDGCPGLEHLTSLTSLHLGTFLGAYNVIPLVLQRLTALQHLSVPEASYTQVQELHALVGLTRLCVKDVVAWDFPSSPLQLAALQCLELGVSTWSKYHHIPMSYLAACPRLQELSLSSLVLTDPGCVLGLTAFKHVLNERVDSLLKTADVELLVTCCSGLRTLQLEFREEEVNLSALTHLPYLTSLSVDGLNKHHAALWLS